MVLCRQSGRCVGHVEATAARGGVCLGRSARDGGGGREEQTVGAFERVRGASSRAPEPGPGRSRPRKARKRAAQDARFRLPTTLARTSGGRVVCSRRRALGSGAMWLARLSVVRARAGAQGWRWRGVARGRLWGPTRRASGSVSQARRGTDGTMVQYSREGQWFFFFVFRGKRKVPAREFRVASRTSAVRVSPATDSRVDEFLRVPHSCVRNTPRQFDRLFSFVSHTRCAPIFENAERESAAVLKGKAAADREKRRAVFNSSLTSHQILGSDRVFFLAPSARPRFSASIAISRTSRGLLISEAFFRVAASR